MSLEERFWSKVNITTPEECWEWTAGLDGHGYGSFKLYGVSNISHRVAWFLTYGNFSKELLRHTCDNPKCCNPNHLLEGTQSDNVKDMIIRERNATGERNGRSKLSESDVSEIWKKIEEGRSDTSISKEYSVNRRAIYSIRNGISWKNILLYPNGQGIGVTYREY